MQYNLNVAIGMECRLSNHESDCSVAIAFKLHELFCTVTRPKELLHPVFVSKWHHPLSPSIPLFRCRTKYLFPIMCITGRKMVGTFDHSFFGFHHSESSSGNSHGVFNAG